MTDWKLHIGIRAEHLGPADWLVRCSGRTANWDDCSRSTHDTHRPREPWFCRQHAYQGEPVEFHGDQVSWHYAEYIRREAAKMPPLTEAQIRKIATLLGGMK